MKKNEALIIIDMQNGFLDSKNSWYTKDSEKIIKPIISLCKKWNREDIYFTKFINKNLRTKRTIHSKFLPKTNESDLVKSLKVYTNKNVFEKNGYSIFKNKKLFNKLNKYRTLYFCGIEADACILFSCAEAYDLLLDFKVVEKAVAGFKAFGGKKQFVKYYKSHFGDILLKSLE